MKSLHWYLVGGIVMLATATVFFLQWNGNTSNIPEIVSYNFHIRPIISDRCFKCHGPDVNQRKADLRLDTENGLFGHPKDDPGGFVIKPGDPESSVLYQRISSSDTSEVMPPPISHLTLNAREISLIKKWIEQGAKYENHWSFIPPAKAALPDVENEEWPANEIDRFILARMESENLEPNDQADKERLLKRLSFDLTGLPPSLDDQTKFLKDDDVNAYEKMADQYLGSRHYGEKMALYWLDVARYADSHGYQDDGLRTMWPWRDWVIHAFNENYPFDKFVVWQLAGDLLPKPSREMLLATGFNRNHKITQEGGVIDEEYRLEYVTDRTNTFAKAFLAMTFECAKCHDHKYDPISQKEYFSTFAFFNQLNEKGLVGDIQLASLADPPRMHITNEDVNGILRFVNKKQKENIPVMIMKDSSVLRKTYLLKRGAYDNPGEEVDFNLPEKIFAFDTTMFQKNRLGLANWVVDKRNPLTARVFVNRLWQEFFGRGIVKTSGDFGMQGELPTNPELLDWLATDFMENGWKIKRLVKQIVMSSTYRQSAEISKEKMAKDPENIWLSRSPRVRLPAEFIKDHALSSSGLLNPEIGGPSVKPYQPKGIWESSTSGRGVLAYYVQDHGDKLYRRGMYNFIKRTVPPPNMLMLDASNRDQCEVKRSRTNTPLQALIMMNDPQMLECSRVLAEKLSLEQLDDRARIEKAFRLVVCRSPEKRELDLLVNYFTDEMKHFAENTKAADALLKQGEFPHVDKVNPAMAAALMQVVTTLYNLDEVVTK